MRKPQALPVAPQAQDSASPTVALAALALDCDASAAGFTVQCLCHEPAPSLGVLQQLAACVWAVANGTAEPSALLVLTAFFF